MDSYNEHDDQRELAIIIHEQENQHDGVSRRKNHLYFYNIK